MILFHGCLVHASTSNLSPWNRVSVYLSLCAVSNHIRRFKRPGYIAHRDFNAIKMPEGLVRKYAAPPQSPDECIFAQTTSCVSADFEHRITPCQFGGNPDCSQCGCIASAALAAVGSHRLPGGVRVGAIFEASLKVGRVMRGRREAVA